MIIKDMIVLIYMMLMLFKIGLPALLHNPISNLRINFIL